MFMFTDKAIPDTINILQPNRLTCTSLHGYKNADHIMLVGRRFQINAIAWITMFTNYVTSTWSRSYSITVDSNLNCNLHISQIIHKAMYQRANLILKCFQSRDGTLLLRAYCTYVRPLLEYCTPVWSPHHSNVGLINKVGVQRSFTKRMSGLKTVSYIDHLAKLGIDSLERRRLNEDLMLCYKLQNNLCDSSISNLFKSGHAAVTRVKLAKLSSNL